MVTRTSPANTVAYWQPGRFAVINEHGDTASTGATATRQRLPKIGADERAVTRACVDLHSAILQKTPVLMHADSFAHDTSGKGAPVGDDQSAGWTSYQRTALNTQLSRNCSLTAQEESTFARRPHDTLRPMVPECNIRQSRAQLPTPKWPAACFVRRKRTVEREVDWRGAVSNILMRVPPSPIQMVVFATSDETR